MPELWQRELEKLDLLEPRSRPPTLGEVPDWPPSRPSAAQRLSAVLVAGVLVAAAGYFLWAALRPTGPNVSAGGSADLEELPDVAVIVCSKEGTAVASSKVQVQADGVHFRVDNEAGLDEVWIVGVDPSGWAADMDLSQATAHVFDRLPPGEWLVGCFTDEELDRPLTAEELPELRGLVPLRVVDPGGLYVSPELFCPEQDTLYLEVIAGADSDSSTAEEFLRDVVPGIRNSDVVEHAGYPESEPFKYDFRIVRDGSVVAHARYVVLEKFAPRVGDLTACRGSGIGEESA